MSSFCICFLEFGRPGQLGLKQSQNWSDSAIHLCARDHPKCQRSRKTYWSNMGSRREGGRASIEGTQDRRNFNQEWKSTRQPCTAGLKKRFFPYHCDCAEYLCFAESGGRKWPGLDHRHQITAPRWCSKRDFAYLDTDADPAYRFHYSPSASSRGKRKKLLLALLQTPIHEVQWLIAKLILGMVLIITAVLFLHLLGKFGPVHLFDYIAFIVAGSYCFSAYGIFLGFLCRNQASARTLGVIFYLPHLLPSAMSDVSQKLTAVAPFLPSYQLYQPLRSILLEDGRMVDMTFDWVYLFLLGSLMFYLSYLLIKRRWLMWFSVCDGRAGFAATQKTPSPRWREWNQRSSYQTSRPLPCWFRCLRSISARKCCLSGKIFLSHYQAIQVLSPEIVRLSTRTA